MGMEWPLRTGVPGQSASTVGYGHLPEKGRGLAALSLPWVARAAVSWAGGPLRREGPTTCAAWPLDRRWESGAGICRAPELYPAPSADLGKRGLMNSAAVANVFHIELESVWTALQLGTLLPAPPPAHPPPAQAGVALEVSRAAPTACVVRPSLGGRADAASDLPPGLGSLPGHALRCGCGQVT